MKKLLTQSLGMWGIVISTIGEERDNGPMAKSLVFARGDGP